MAAPAVPTATSIVTEALKRAGYSNPSSAQITRGEGEYMAEVKNDIFMLGKKLKPLYTASVLVLTEGRSRYSNPTDYASDMVMDVMYGSHVGTLQAGAAGSFTLSATESIGATSIIGKDLLITSGTGIGSMSQVVTYSDTTKAGSPSPNFTTAPANGSGYMIVDTYQPLIQKPDWEMGKIDNIVGQGRPLYYFPIGDADYGEFILKPAPYTSDTTVYALRMKYYANLLTLDLAGTLQSTLYHRWRNLYTQGVLAKQLQDDDDNRADRENQKYIGLLQAMILRETYGMDLTNLQMNTSDY